MKRRRLLIAAFAALALSAAAAEDTAFKRFPNALGAQFAGAFTAAEPLGGLSYQRWLGGGWGLQALAGASVGGAGAYRYNAALAMQYRVYADDFNDWFSGALYLNAVLGHAGSDGGYGNGYSPSFYLGGGIGIETLLLSHLAPSIEFMYMAALEPLRSYPFSLGFALGGSLRYRY